MALSSQRLILLLLAINLVVGIAMETYHNSSTYPDQQITTETLLLEQYEDEIESTEGIWGAVIRTTAEISESTIGNALKWGWNILRIMVRGLNPFSFSSSDFVHPLEQKLADVLILFRSMLTSIIIIEGYMFFKNKKTS